MIKIEEDALRLARTIISDIVVYHRDSVVEGIKNDNIFDLLKSQIEEGLNFYENQVDPSIVKKNNFFNEALVDILLKEGSEVESKIW